MAANRAVAKAKSKPKDPGPNALLGGIVPSMNSLPGQWPGMVQPGNIDLAARLPAPMPGGGYGTVYSESVGVPGGEMLLPRIWGGQLFSWQEALDRFRQTGLNLGLFRTPQDADAYAEALHRQQAEMYGGYGR